MTQFKRGDRVKYSGNTKGLYFNEGNVGLVGTFERTVPKDYLTSDEECSYVVFDGTTYTQNVFTHNLSPEVVVDPVVDVFNKYVGEFDRIVKDGTAVERYTAIGFLYSFANDMANSVPEE